jgi:hypothetical protein
MTTGKSPQDRLSPFLFLDEFNDGTMQDSQNLNTFMRACQDRGFYLIIITSKREVANNIIELNPWAKMLPLKYFHDGSTENIIGQPGYDENKTPDWKRIDWTPEQIKRLVLSRFGPFDNYDFILAGMTPVDALLRAKERKHQDQQDTSLTNNSSLSAGG